MGPKQFLLQECNNVRQLLNATLKHRYGLDGSREFFEECSTRLDYIAHAMQRATPDDNIALRALGGQLNDLSWLICRIERSSLGEYSWPFVECLKEIANAICTEDTLHEKDVPPKVYVLADGGLDKYAIFPEQKRPSASKRLILTIVFPKTLKDYVLLHPILGHELGHALWRCSKHQRYIKQNVIPALTSDGIFASPAATAAHLFSQSAPIEAITELEPFRSGGLNHTNFFRWAQWTAWIEEILCDLIGVLIFGQSFIAAECELLRALVPSGISIGRDHPPVSWRINMVLRCAEILGLDKFGPEEQRSHDGIQALWKRLKSYRATHGWHSVFSDSQLETALEALRKLLDPHPPAACPPTDFEILGRLLAQLEQKVPPTGFQAVSAGNIAHPELDFRYVLYAGWIAAQLVEPDRFDTINKLCQHGLMQQRAIDIGRSRKQL